MTHLIADILRWLVESVGLALAQQAAALGVRWLLGLLGA